MAKSAVIGTMLRLGMPDRPAPIVQPPARTPPNPIKDAPAAKRPKWAEPSKLCHDKRPEAAADKNAPAIAAHKSNTKLGTD
jgi:hypothetical protein